MRYISSPDFRHDSPERIGVLLVNTGTPDSLTVRDVRRFLARFLSDPRVIELPRALWLPILHGVVLRTRPRRVAAKYRKIWTAEGSPLLVLSQQLRTILAGTLAQRVLAPFSVELGMLYSRPTIGDALERLRETGAVEAPQYCGNSGTTRMRCAPASRSRSSASPIVGRE